MCEVDYLCVKLAPNKKKITQTIYSIFAEYLGQGANIFKRDIIIIGYFGIFAQH